MIEMYVEQLIRHVTGSGCDYTLPLVNFPCSVDVVHVISFDLFFRVMVSCCVMIIPSMKESLLENACCLARYEA